MCTVHEHIPNPLKCRNCQKLGHTKNHCKRITLCAECALPPPHDNCDRKFCVNCNIDTHTSNDPKCPSFLKHKSVNKIKLTQRCTVREAWKIFNNNPSAHLIEPYVPRTSFAQIVSGNFNSSSAPTISTSQNITVTSNTSLTPLQTSSTQPSTQKTHTTTSSLAQIIHSTTEHDKQSPKKQQHSSLSGSQSGLSTITKEKCYNKISTDDTNNNNNNSKNEEKTTTNNTHNEQQTTTSNISSHSQKNMQMDYSAHPEDSTSSPLREAAVCREEEMSPCSRAFNKFTDLNVLITPETYRRTAAKNTQSSNPNS